MTTFRWLDSLRTRTRENRARRSMRNAARRRSGGTLKTIEELESRTLLSAGPVVETLELVNDTGTAGDMITTDATLTGSVEGGAPTSYFMLEIDYDGDGNMEETGSVDANGDFTFDPGAAIWYGQNTVSVRAVEYDDMAMMHYGDWESITFTYEAPPNDPPEITSLGLANDTGTAGDMITTDGTLVGTISDDTTVSSVMIEFDFDGDGVYEDSTYTDANGNFTFDVGPHAAFGEVTVAVRAVEYDNNLMDFVYSEWETITFTYEDDNQPPAISEFSAVDDGNTWTFSGWIIDESPGGLLVTFGDLLEGHSVTADANGWFVYTVLESEINDWGLVTAQTTDIEGLDSEMVQQFLA